ncbi:hydrophobin precursor [Microthyrium microscopicum]|uniref:Hydrophobin n=1 Tax=Microthyrium microscopicum TaxID=703497 RepID=A0A6A6UKL8_9PEZI|nr:hydrophobin precursor [Microthyrium microscopicum]
MKLSITATIVAVGLASCSPLVARQAAVPLCSGLTGTTQCCATDVLGLADLDCANPPQVPTNSTNFVSICAAIGQRARCCAIPILGQDLICGAPVGT